MSKLAFILFRSHPRFPISLGRRLFDRCAEEVYTAALKRTQYAPLALLQRLQLMRLQELICHTYHTVPFWREYLGRYGIQPPWPGSFEEFLHLPPVEKAEYRDHSSEYYASRSVPKSERVVRTTSGTDGIPLTIVLDMNMFPRRRATYRRHLEWVGRKSGDQVIRILPYEYSELQPHGTFFLCKGIEDLTENRHRLYSVLEEKTSIIHSYLSTLLQLARLMDSDGKIFQIRAAITHAEQISPEIRAYIERVFRAPVFDYYACNEVHAVAQECKTREGLHINTENVFVEILNKDGKSVGDGEVGDVVLTGFDNIAMPFIRYRVGDRARFLAEPCSCGVILPRIFIEGRAVSTFPLPNGRTGHLFELFKPIYKRIPKIFQYQIIQVQLNKFRIKIVPTSFLVSDDEREIVEELKEYLGDSVILESELVERIEIVRGKERVFIPLVISSSFLQ